MPSDKIAENNLSQILQENKYLTLVLVFKLSDEAIILVAVRSSVKNKMCRHVIMAGQDAELSLTSSSN